MMSLSSPILIIILVRNYFNYKSESNQKLLALQKESDNNDAITATEKLEQLTERVIVLERIVTSNGVSLSEEIRQL